MVDNGTSGVVVPYYNDHNEESPSCLSQEARLGRRQKVICQWLLVSFIIVYRLVLISVFDHFYSI